MTKRKTVSNLYLAPLTLASGFAKLTAIFEGIEEKRTVYTDSIFELLGVSFTHFPLDHSISDSVRYSTRWQSELWCFFVDGSDLLPLRTLPHLEMSPPYFLLLIATQ
jgi:hypothetical protein